MKRLHNMRDGKRRPLNGLHKQGGSSHTYLTYATKYKGDIGRLWRIARMKRQENA